jgi:hypothetical protein
MIFRSTIKNGKDSSVDCWTTLLSELQVHKARTRLRDLHQLKLKTALYKNKISTRKEILVKSKSNPNEILGRVFIHLFVLQIYLYI